MNGQTTLLTVSGLKNFSNNSSMKLIGANKAKRASMGSTLPVDFTEHDVESSNDRDNVRHQVTETHLF